MFNKPKDTPNSSADSAGQPPVKRSSAMKSKAPSIISADMVLSGSLNSEGEIQLDGSVKGDVQAGSLTIGENASVDGEVIAENVIVRGKVKGSIMARQVQLAATARIEGDIVHSALSMESGAFFDGHCRHSSDPVADAGKKTGNNTTRSTKAASNTSSLSSDNEPSAPPKAASGSSSSSSLDLPKAKSSS